MSCLPSIGIAACGLLKVMDLWMGLMASPFSTPPHPHPPLALQPLQLSWLCQAEASALVLGWEQVADVVGAAARVSPVLPARWKSAVASTTAGI